MRLCLSVILACNFLFFVISLSGFGIRVMVVSWNEFLFSLHKYAEVEFVDHIVVLIF